MIARFPSLIFLLSLAVFTAAAWLGATKFSRARAHVDQHRDEFGVIQGATLTLLGLIIGFTFSMALNRYESRIGLEEEEANAIGTEYLRADLLPATDAESTSVSTSPPRRRACSRISGSRSARLRSRTLRRSPRSPCPA